MAPPTISAAATRSLVLVMLAGASLAACATPQPRYPDRLPTQARPYSPNTAGRPPSGGGSYKVGKPYQVGGIWYVPREDPNYDKRGVASWYGDAFHNKKTANGEIFDKNGLTAAHTTLPLPSIVEVTNLENGRKIRVRVNDRGPFVNGRVIDLSHAAARELGYDRQGLAKVRVRYVGRAPLSGGGGVPARKMSMADDVDEMQDEAQEAAEAPAVLAQAPPPPPPRTDVYQVQAGAFGDVVNAERAAASLSGVGARPVIEPVAWSGQTLYRVLVPASSDEGEAWALRDVVAGYGFADARVIRPF